MRFITTTLIVRTVFHKFKYQLLFFRWKVQVTNKGYYNLRKPKVWFASINMNSMEYLYVCKFVVVVINFPLSTLNFKP